MVVVVVVVEDMMKKGEGILETREKGRGVKDGDGGQALDLLQCEDNREGPISIQAKATRIRIR